jgi:hypothetical protein
MRERSLQVLGSLDRRQPQEALVKHERGNKASDKCFQVLMCESIEESSITNGEFMDFPNGSRRWLSWSSRIVPCGNCRGF